MHVVELLERLREQGTELVWWDRAGPVWQGPPPPLEAEPWVQERAVNLMYAVRGAGTGHVWGACSVCDQAQLVPVKAMRESRHPTKPKPRTCRLTPRCKGELGRWIELPVAAQAWEALKATRKLAVAQAQAAEAERGASGGLLGLGRPAAGRPQHQGRITRPGPGL